MKCIVVAVPHSHTWFWTQTCLASLWKNPPRANDYKVLVVVVDSSPWSPAIEGVRCFKNIHSMPFHLDVLKNFKNNKFHASALDCVVESYDFDYLMALETDVLALCPDWLQWFVDQMRDTDYAVGHWHHEQFINPSCTLYMGDALRGMQRWCRLNAPQDELRWGANFERTAPLDTNLHNAENPASVLQGMKDWIGGPFAEKRGFAEGTVLKEKPTGQEKGPGHYEPGQQLHHWAIQAGFTYKVCSTFTAKTGGVPICTTYGEMFPPLSDRQREPLELFDRGARTAHMWGGTRALDILKHEVTDPAIQQLTPGWLAREAMFWRAVVPEDVQTKTLELMHAMEAKTGSMFHYRGQGADHVTERDKQAAEYVKRCYRAGGVDL